jgi:uncharacterized hydrophobic protein (TIGR00271 family)
MYTSDMDTALSKQKAIEDLKAMVGHNLNYYVLLFGSILIALGAIFTDSIAVLIASMIVSPLASPILALGLGITARDWQYIGKVLLLLVISCMIAFGLSALITILFPNERIPDHYISFDGNRTIAVGIAVVSGFIAAYGTIRPRVSAAITGVAIAVSLMPPLVATGVNYVGGDVPSGNDALVLFLLNVVGILLASIITFAAFGMGSVLRGRKDRPIAN